MLEVVVVGVGRIRVGGEDEGKGKGAKGKRGRWGVPDEEQVGEEGGENSLTGILKCGYKKVVL